MPAILRNLVSGLVGQMRDMEVASRNLMNLQTPGYRRDRLVFRDLMYEAMTMSRDLAGRDEPAPVGIGADVRAPQLIHDQGELQWTGRDLDLAISGEGFFQYRLEDGTIAYSRYGTLQLSPDGRLINSDGLVLQPEIQLPPGVHKWHVDADGTIRGERPDGTQVQLETRITLARFANPAALSRLGPYLLTPTDQSGPPIEGAPADEGFGVVLQGHMELSNVDYTEEMIRILQAQRTYQVGLRALQALDESLALANSLRR